MNKKLFLAAFLVALFVIGYFLFVKKSEPVAEQQKPTSAQTSASVNKTSESEVIASLKTNWRAVQDLIPFQPGVYYQSGVPVSSWWFSDVQFIGENTILVGFTDDNNPHVAVLKFDNGKFSLLKVFENQGDFFLPDWQNLVDQYGDNSYPVSTYTRGLLRNKQIVSFDELTKVPENIFVQKYWEMSWD